MGNRSDLDAVLAAMRQAASSEQSKDTRDKGNRFERLIQAAFESDPGLGFDKVWFWDEYPGRRGGIDLGVDLVARDAETGDHVAIQCKFWAVERITLTGVNAFLAASSRDWCSKRILVNTAPGIEPHGWTQIRGAHPPCEVMNSDALGELRVNWWAMAESSDAVRRPRSWQRSSARRRKTRRVQKSRRRRSLAFYQVLLVSVALLIAAVSEGDIGGMVLLGSIAGILVLLRIRDWWQPSSSQSRSRLQRLRVQRRSERPAAVVAPSTQSALTPVPLSSSASSPSSLPPPPASAPVSPVQMTETSSDLRTAQPTLPSEVVSLASSHFGMSEREVVHRAKQMFGPDRAHRSADELSRLWNAIIDEQTAPKKPASPAAVEAETAARPGSADDLLADLTAEQQRAVTSSASPLCVIAGAGSGKTRVLTRRIAWQAMAGRIDPQHVLAVTFTRRAAGELRKRLRQLGLSDAVAAGTFHASALSMLRRYWEAKGESHPTILQSRTALLGDLRPDWGPKKLRNAEAKISWASSRMIAPEEYPEAIVALGRRSSGEDHEVAAVYRDYVIAKQERRCIDFDDMLDLARRVLPDDSDFATDQHRRQRHLLVDEFQDVNPLQFKLLEALRGPESTLVIVGDPKQAIFGWNGADPELLVQIDHHLPGVTRLHLTTNFRSSPEICEASARILNVQPQPTVRPSGAQPRVRELLGFVVPDDLATYEATEIAKAVRAAREPGAPWGDQAVLARTNPQLDPIRDAFHRAGIPVRSRSEQAVLQIPEVEDFLLDYEEADRLSMLVGDLDRMASAESVGEVWGRLLEFARDALALDPASTVEDLVDALRSDDGLTPIEDGVDLSTIHRAKGLEWPVVHLIGVENGYLPDYRNTTGERRREERRLLYVAASRAESELHLSWCRLRDGGGRTPRKRHPSPWVKCLMPADR